MLNLKFNKKDNEPLESGFGSRVSDLMSIDPDIHSFADLTHLTCY